MPSFSWDGRDEKRSTPSTPKSGLAGWANALGVSMGANNAETKSTDPLTAATAQSSPQRSPLPDGGSATGALLRKATGFETSSPSPLPRNPATKSNTAASRLMSAISSRFSNPSPSTPADDDNELFNLDIETVLFPSGVPADCETLSAEAFKALRMNATSAISKMQNAYQQQAVQILELSAQKASRDADVEEAEGRIRNLKAQLDDMARKAAEQEQAMNQLMEELTAEMRAKASMEEMMSRQSSINGDGHSDSDGGRWLSSKGRHWRASGATSKSSEASFEMDEESGEADSVFSRSRSPTKVMSTSTSIADGPTATSGAATQQLKVPSSKRSTLLTPPTSNSATGAIHKFFWGPSPAESEGGCRLCQGHGQDVSVAWDTVGLLRDENRGLKQRVAEVEHAVEQALDVINCVGMPTLGG